MPDTSETPEKKPRAPRKRTTRKKAAPKSATAESTQSDAPAAGDERGA